VSHLGQLNWDRRGRAGRGSQRCGANSQQLSVTASAEHGSRSCQTCPDCPKRCSASCWRWTVRMGPTAPNDSCDRSCGCRVGPGRGSTTTAGAVPRGLSVSFPGPSAPGWASRLFRRGRGGPPSGPRQARQRLPPECPLTALPWRRRPSAMSPPRRPEPVTRASPHSRGLARGRLTAAGQRAPRCSPAHTRLARAPAPPIRAGRSHCTAPA
jgi:hypothetical protein